MGLDRGYRLSLLLAHRASQAIQLGDYESESANAQARTRSPEFFFTASNGRQYEHPMAV
jgi:hypothetical protein